MDRLEQLFLNPTPEFRGKPFWSWNGKLNKEELLKQIENLKAMGMGGYFCHSRTGLITEYLGDEWFDLINACAEKGEELNMETWLYDEDRWPSGTAGGMVTENPEYRMKYIRLSVVDGSEFKYDNTVLAAFTAELNGWAFTNKKRIGKNDKTENITVLKFTIEEMARDSFYNGNTYVDTMNKKATEKFIELTHKKYEEKCPGKLGKTIKGIFTDEPHHGAVMCGFSLLNEEPEYLTPCPALLFEEFKKAYGYDLMDYLPELYLWKDGEKISPVKWQYMELIEKLFLENFLKPIHDYCKSKDMLFTGHLLHEDSLTTQGCMIGSIMRAYEYLDCPGVDVLTEHNYAFWIVKQLQSAARQLGKDKLLSELYGCTGWQFNFESHKAVGDWQALFGINMRCHHLSWVSMQGEAKRDYPASISHQSAWFKEYKYIEDYFSRIGLMMSRGRPVCDLLVINPVESTFAAIYPKWSWCLGTNDTDIDRIESIYRETFHILCGAKIDFDYGDEDFIKRFGKVEICDGVPLLKIGASSYKSVLVTEMLTMRQTTLDLLNEFVKAGGNAVFAGDVTSYIDAVKSDKAKKLKAQYIKFDKDEIINSLRINPVVKVTDKDGNNINDIFAQVRKDGQSYVILLLNVNRQESYKNVTVKLSVSGYCEQWDARSGKRLLLAKGDNITFNTDFEPDGELLLVITDKDNKLPAVRMDRKPVKTVAPGKEFSYSLSEPNVCVLDFVDYQINDDDKAYGVEILKTDIELRKKFGIEPRGGCMLQPWFVKKSEQKELCSLKLDYSFNISDIPEKVKLAVEEPENFEILINGKKALSKTDGFWVDSCFKIFDIDTSSLRKGKNTIQLKTSFRADMNLEAIYLLGEFGVTLNGREATIIKLPERLKIGDIVNQGLPFYGADVIYYTDMPVINKNEELIFKADDFNTACIKVSDGKNQKIIACKPYSADISDFDANAKALEIHYVLTRRNTFGPLHQYPLIAGAYGPESFISEGDGFLNDSYGLLPQGMTSGVSLIIMK